MKAAIGAGALCIVLSGCAAYEAKPLDPARSEVQFRSRRLSDPALGEYVRAHLPAPPPAWPLESWDLPALTLAAF